MGFIDQQSIVSANRRQNKRFQVALPGTVQVDGRTHPVMIRDISSGGALVSLKSHIAGVRSVDIVVSIKGFGSIPAKIVRTDAGSWGVSFANPQQHRFRLIGWLQQDVNS